MREWVKDGTPEDVEVWLQNRRRNDILKPQGSDSVNIQSPINAPIEQRNTAKGNPNAVLQYGRPLNERQKVLLEQLPEFDSRVIVSKNAVNMRDLSALTAETGVEYAMFTRQGERLIIRGDQIHVAVTEEQASQLNSDGYRWSGHTHPGEGLNVRIASSGDKAVLKLFRQNVSAIWDWHGQFQVFEKED